MYSALIDSVGSKYVPSGAPEQLSVSGQQGERGGGSIHSGLQQPGY